MSESAQPQAPPRHAPIALWQAAHALLTALFNLFGAPEQLAAQQTLTKSARDLLLIWLRPAEAILRRLIFIEAHKLRENAPPASSPRAGKRPARKPATSAFDPADPDAWRVSFRCSTPSTRRPRAARPRRQAPSRQIFTRPLAARFEALLRAFNDPAPYAQRLARRRNPSGANRIQDEPPPNTRDLYGRELYDTLDFHYRAALHGIDTG